MSSFTTSTWNGKRAVKVVKHISKDCSCCFHGMTCWDSTCKKPHIVTACKYLNCKFGYGKCRNYHPPPVGRICAERLTEMYTMLYETYIRPNPFKDKPIKVLLSHEQNEDQLGPYRQYISRCPGPFKNFLNYLETMIKLRNTGVQNRTALIDYISTSIDESEFFYEGSYADDAYSADTDDCDSITEEPSEDKRSINRYARTFEYYLNKVIEDHQQNVSF